MDIGETGEKDTPGGVSSRCTDLGDEHGGSRVWGHGSPSVFRAIGQKRGMVRGNRKPLGATDRAGYGDRFRGMQGVGLREWIWEGRKAEEKRDPKWGGWPCLPPPPEEHLE